jgi:hypothetical protein
MLVQLSILFRHRKNEFFLGIKDERQLAFDPIFLEISPICPVTAVSREETQTVWIHGTKPETTCDPSFGTCGKGNLKDAPDLFPEELP